MFSYFIIPSLSSFFLSLGLKFSKKKILLIIFLYLIFVFFAGMRGYSNDYDNYSLIFYEINNLGLASFFESDKEPLFVAINLLLGFLDFQFLIFFFAILSVYLNFKLYSKVPFFFFAALAIYSSNYYLLKDFGQIRNAIASPLVCLSLFYYSQRNFKTGLICFFAALGTHYSSLIAVPLLFFDKLSNRIQLLIVVLMYLLFFFLGGFLEKIIEYIPSTFGLYEKIKIYSSWEIYSWDIEPSNPKLIMQCFFVSLIFILRKRLSAIGIPRIFLSAYIFSLIWLLFFSDVAIVASRGASVISHIEVVVIPSILLLVLKNKFIYKFSIILVSILYISYNILNERVFEYTVFGVN